jgi:hypothetical protein
MRTTVTIDDRLLAQLKQRAAETGRTVSELVEDAIRESLLRQKGPASRVKLKTWHGGGRLPGVDLDDNAALLELMEGQG